MLLSAAQPQKAVRYLGLQYAAAPLCSMHRSASRPKQVLHLQLL